MWRRACDGGLSEETWYSFIDQADIDEIIDSHLLGGQVVERLKI